MFPVARLFCLVDQVTPVLFKVTNFQEKLHMMILRSTLHLSVPLQETHMTVTKSSWNYLQNLLAIEALNLLKVYCQIILVI